MQKILENIEVIRKKKGLKQELLAEKLGVKQNTYSNYINRSKDIYLGKLSQIADILECSVVDIITYPEEYIPKSSVKSCERCKELDRAVKNLNDYIEILKTKK